MKINELLIPSSDISYTISHGMVSEREAKNRFPVARNAEGEKPMDRNIIYFVRIRILFLGSLPNVFWGVITTVS